MNVCILPHVKFWNNRGNFKAVNFGVVHVDSRLLIVRFKSPLQMFGHDKVPGATAWKRRNLQVRKEQTRTNRIIDRVLMVAAICLPANTREGDKTTASRPRPRTSPQIVLKHLTIGIFNMLTFKSATCLFLIPAPVN